MRLPDTTTRISYGMVEEMDGVFHLNLYKHKRGEWQMKEGIHPQYKETTISCACGEVIHTRSTKQNIKVDICSKCHPFFTGKQKLVDTGGRVDRFNKRYSMK
jgi:large subunit ribosomal protein L31